MELPTSWTQIRHFILDSIPDCANGKLHLSCSCTNQLNDYSEALWVFYFINFPELSFKHARGHLQAWKLLTSVNERLCHAVSPRALLSKQFYPDLFARPFLKSCGTNDRSFSDPSQRMGSPHFQPRNWTMEHPWRSRQPQRHPIWASYRTWTDDQWCARRRPFVETLAILSELWRQRTLRHFIVVHRTLKRMVTW